MVEQILTISREVRDPRDFTARHDLGELLFLVLCGLLCGEKTCVDIATSPQGMRTSFATSSSCATACRATTQSRGSCGCSTRTN